MKSPDWQREIERALGLDEAHWTPAGDSGWGQSFALVAGLARYFVKTASGRYASTIDAEADGLAALASTRTIRVPRIVRCVAIEDGAALVLEWLDLHRSRDGAALGGALAALHRAPAPQAPSHERFGWHRDNWIGGTPQQNGWVDDWPSFFRDRRLAPQLEEAARNGGGRALRREGDRLLAALPTLVEHAPAPSLLHGDLWSGNASAVRGGEPTIFDPAVYVGDREADVAMTELFGGFGVEFYAGYRDAWPLAADYETRRDVYNLYHVLNHFNLFGGGYLAQAQSMIRRLLAVTT